MNMRRSTAVVCAVVLCLMTPAVSGSDPAGFTFLEVPAGARASALGGAYATRALGVEAAFWNPAGLAAVKGVQVVASHYEFLGPLRYAQFGAAQRMFGGGASISLRAQYSEPIVERDAQGNAIGTFGYHGLELALGYGREVAPGVSLGATAQMVRERVAESSATAWAMGAGAAWEPAALPRLRLSGSAHNIGTSPTFLIEGVPGEPVSLPAAVQVGASYGAPVGGIDLRGSLEARLTRGWTGIGMAGLEASHSSGAALELGYRMNDDSASLSYGAGYGRQALRLDYAFVPFELDLGDTHRFSATFQF